jgi:hypothetical protein
MHAATADAMLMMCSMFASAAARCSPAPCAHLQRMQLPLALRPHEVAQDAPSPPPVQKYQGIHMYRMFNSEHAVPDMAAWAPWKLPRYMSTEFGISNVVQVPVTLPESCCQPLAQRSQPCVPAAAAGPVLSVERYIRGRSVLWNMDISNQAVNSP